MKRMKLHPRAAGAKKNAVPPAVNTRQVPREKTGFREEKTAAPWLDRKDWLLATMLVVAVS